MRGWGGWRGGLEEFSVKVWGVSCFPGKSSRGGGHVGALPALPIQWCSFCTKAWLSKRMYSSLIGATQFLIPSSRVTLTRMGLELSFWRLEAFQKASRKAFWKAFSKA